MLKLRHIRYVYPNSYARYMKEIEPMAQSAGWKIYDILEAVSVGDKWLYEILENETVVGILIVAHMDMPEGSMLFAEWVVYKGKAPFEKVIKAYTNLTQELGYAFSACFVRPGLSRKYGRVLRDNSYKDIKHLYIRKN